MMLTERPSGIFICHLETYHSYIKLFSRVGIVNVDMTRTRKIHLVRRSRSLTRLELIYDTK